MMKVLGEKQEATEQFIHQQQEEAIGEAEARLCELQAHSRTLQESRSQIKAVHNLSDTELIKVVWEHCLFKRQVLRVFLLSVCNKMVNFIALNRNRW